MSRKERIDLLLVERGLAESRSQAQRLVMAGQVRAAGQRIHKPSQRVDRGSSITIEEMPRFVSRGGDKLLAALDQFPVNVEGRVCADVGASTGGFTDCLLQHGAARVYAVDTGYGVLAWKLRRDERVVVMERTNAMHVELPEPVDLVAVDPLFNLYDDKWPIRTFQPQYPPAKFVFADEGRGARRGEAHDSVVSQGCIISGGRVLRCVLAPGVFIHSYAHVEDSVLFEGVDIGRYCRIRRAIIDEDVHIPPNTVIGYDLDQDRERFHVTENGVVVISKRAVVPQVAELVY